MHAPASRARQVAGASGNVVLDGHEDEEGIADESYGEAIIAALGMERRNEVLARLYIIRCDRHASDADECD